MDASYYKGVADQVLLERRYYRESLTFETVLDNVLRIIHNRAKVGRYSINIGIHNAELYTEVVLFKDEIIKELETRGFTIFITTRKNKEENYEILF